jgi:hypothetical protein
MCLDINVHVVIEIVIIVVKIVVVVICSLLFQGHGWLNELGSWIT